MIKKHRDNLLKLAAYLETLPDDYEQFDMAEYMILRNGDHPGHYETLDIYERPKSACGTAACAVGHGPAAGIRVYNDDSWSDYCDRVFGEFEEDFFGWDYLFSSSWTYTDNTPKGAAARIRTYLALGRTPQGWTYEDAKTINTQETVK